MGNCCGITADTAVPERCPRALQSLRRGADRRRSERRVSGSRGAVSRNCSISRRTCARLPRPSVTATRSQCVAGREHSHAARLVTGSCTAARSQATRCRSRPRTRHWKYSMRPMRSIQHPRLRPDSCRRVLGRILDARDIAHSFTGRACIGWACSLPIRRRVIIASGSIPTTNSMMPLRPNCTTRVFSWSRTRANPGSCVKLTPKTASMTRSQRFERAVDTTIEPR